MTTAPPSIDVAIVGGGLVGALLALLLAREGLHILIVEKKIIRDISLQNQEDTRNLGLNYGTVKLFEAWGLAEVIKAQGQKIQHIEISDRGHSGVVHIDSDDESLPYLGYCVPFNQLLIALQTKMLAHPCIHCVEGEVTDLKSQEKGVSLQVGKSVFQSQLLIGADGVDSVVRQKMGWSLMEHDYQQSALIGAVEISHSFPNTAYERFTTEGPIALLPTHTPGVMTVVWVLPTARARLEQAMPNEIFCQDLQHVFSYRAGVFRKMGKIVSYPLKRAVASQCYRDRVGLLGNAAHLLHPVAGQGFNLSVRDVLTFVEVVRRRHGQLDAAIWVEYARLSSSQQAQMSGLTHNFVKVFERSEWPIKMARNAILHGLEGVSPLKTLLNDIMIGRM